MPTFIQLGATRDGLDPYLKAARGRGMEAVLIETPDYLRWRRTLGRQEFDRTLAVEHPAEAAEVLTALAEHALHPTLLLAGFERYTTTAYAVARQLEILPWCPGEAFRPLDKGQQRRSLTAQQTPVMQPEYAIWRDVRDFDPVLLQFTYPYVMKPVDGGGGLGVFLVRNAEEQAQALATLQRLTNYDGGAFQGMIVEQYVSGEEYSVQGVVQDGQVRCLATCQKCIGIEERGEASSVRGFRELGHLASSGERTDPVLKRCVQACVAAFGYQNGPFHADFVQSGQDFVFLEMGFRLSGGGLVRLVERASGYNWAEEVFRLHLRETSARSAVFQQNGAVVGQISLRSQAEIETAQRLQQQGYELAIERFAAPGVIPAASSLTSDLLRHSGFVARVVLSTPTLEETRRLLERCLAQPLVPTDQVL